VAESRKKTLSYRRAEYFCDHPESVNLGLCVKLATDKCKTANQRAVTDDGNIVVPTAPAWSGSPGWLRPKLANLASSSDMSRPGHRPMRASGCPMPCASASPAELRDRFGTMKRR
jgi:hypothetical protein